jgi:hypothetical protein
VLTLLFRRFVHHSTLLQHAAAPRTASLMEHEKQKQPFTINLPLRV